MAGRGRQLRSIQPRIYFPLYLQKDNGRVLGYDSAHGHHHRHFMGTVEEFEFVSYAALADKFFHEVAEICRKSEKEN